MGGWGMGDGGWGMRRHTNHDGGGDSEGAADDGVDGVPAVARLDAAAADARVRMRSRTLK